MKAPIGGIEFEVNLKPMRRSTNLKRRSRFKYQVPSILIYAEEYEETYREAVLKT